METLGLPQMRYLQTWLDKILDIAFPPRCAVCRKAGIWFCDSCFEKISIEPDTSCPEGIDSCISFVPYANREMRMLITSLKYQNAECLLPTLKRLIAKCGYQHDPAWTVTWAPASHKRLLERGIDHAQLISRIFSPQSVQLLERTRNTVSNATLEQPEMRQGNVSGAFRAIQKVPERVILVDDVKTSGATASACAKALRDGGAKEVRLITLAYGG